MEVFKDIDMNTNYQISNYGRIYNKKTKHYLKIYFTKSRGQTAMRVNGKRINLYPHRLVAEYFIPNTDNLPEVDHIDRDITNNHFTNLRWADKYLQNQNRNNNKNNKSGHRCIFYKEKENYWVVKKMINDIRYETKFKSKIDAICYKYILLLKIKSKLIY